MPSVKKNLIWNILLTISGYLFPLLTFPYVTRVLGPENLGAANFALSMVDYAILFATFGLTTIGYRYIPQCNDDVEKRNHVFNHLVTLHILMSAIVILIYTICVFVVPKLYESKELLLVGIAKVVMNIFLVEWLFQGMQDFKYITIRTLITRVLYVFGVFIFVRDVEDYDNYVFVTIAQVVLNAVINWRYTRKYVTFKLSFRGMKEYLFPVFSMGINRILFSFYGTFNIMYLGFVCNNESVGYFTTATRLYSIFLSLLTAYNGVFVPYLNSLFGKGEMEQFKKVVGYSFSIVGLLSIPLIIGGIVLAPQIIRLIAGSGYESAILPFQIVLIQLLCVGIAQILENQILLSFKKFKEVLLCTSVSTAVSILILIFFTKQYAEVAAAAAVAIPHIIEVLLLYSYAKKTIDFEFPKKDYILNSIVCLPIVAICFAVQGLLDNYLMILGLSIAISIVYFYVMQCLVLKNAFLIEQINKLPLPIKMRNA